MSDTKIVTANKELNRLLNGKGQVAPPKLLMGRLTIVRTKDPDSNEPWPICTPQQVPEWVKHPDVLAQLADGLMCQDPEKSGYWYRAIDVLELAH